MVTGFDIDGQRIAKAQVQATNRLAEAIERLVVILENKEAMKL
jgi:hypothetical protein